MSNFDVKELKSLLIDFAMKDKGMSLKDKLPKINDLEKLTKYRDKLDVRTPDREREYVESRILEVLKDELPRTKDLEKLIHYWKNIEFAGSFIETRMSEALNAVPANVVELPDWFCKILKGKLQLPPTPSLKKLFSKKILMLLDSVNKFSFE